MEHVTPLHIARFFLEKSKELDPQGLSNMYLNKITYIAHAYHWGNLEKPLITNGEYAEAWQHGPVFPSIYALFNSFGKKPIPYNFFKEDYVLRLPEESQILQFLNFIWDKCKDASVWDLVDAVHEKGSPWHIAWNELGGRWNKGTIIPDSLTEYYYTKIVRKLKQRDA